VKVGDLVFDHSYGLNGIIIKLMLLCRPVMALVFYQGGFVHTAYENEIEVISESR